MNEAIVATDLTKSYKEVRALCGLSLAVPEGSVLGLLGPNGAGKTTAVRILTTLLPPDAGTAIVAGIDVARRPRRGAPQHRRVRPVRRRRREPHRLREPRHGRAAVPPRSQASRGQRARELLEQFDLADAGDRPAKTYSGGMRRRLDLAGALVARPPVLFLDEPTTGLDPRSRTDLWGVIADLVQGGTTLLLTTQYLEEAERLADNILVIDHGTAIAEGTADELKAKVGGERLELVASDDAEVATIVSTITDIGSDRPAIDGRRICLPVATGPKALMEAVRRLDEMEIELHDVGLRRPTLDDVFLALTGHAAEDDPTKPRR